MTVVLPQDLVVIFFAWIVIFLVSLSHAMGRVDLDPVSRLTWVVVLILVPFFGVLLYAISLLTIRQPRQTYESDVSGTPWADNPGFTGKDSKD